MSSLGFSQKPIVMPHYPHMLAEDVEVRSEYLVSPVYRIDEVWYDVHVGPSVEVANNAEEVTVKIARGLTRKRIDAVCRVGAEYWVIEVKPWASMLALGQSLAYPRLFADEYPVKGVVVGVVVCEHADPVVLPLFERAGVMVIEV